MRWQQRSLNCVSNTRYVGDETAPIFFRGRFFMAEKFVIEKAVKQSTIYFFAGSEWLMLLR